MSVNTVNTDDIGDVNFSIDLTSPDPKALAAGFNEYGVKDTDDRVEFVFEAMQPGMRNGVKITQDFLKTVANNFENEQPAQVDHDRSMMANAGRVTEMWFSEGALRLRGYVPKTGAQTHQEFVNRFTFDPPQVQNGSVGFGMEYELSEDDQGNPMLIDGQMQEFSFLPFPGGYDEPSGGLKAQFEKAREKYAKHQQDYQHATGDWVERSYSGGEVYGKVRDRTRDSFTVDGNTVEGDEGEPVYKLEEHKDGEFTGQMIAATQSSVSSWSGPSDSEDMSKEYAEQEEIDEAYSDWESAVNMTASQLETWSEHPCADTASQNPETVRKRNMMLLETPKSEWGQKEVDAAGRTVSFISRMKGSSPEGSGKEGGKGTCPSEWAVSLLNWAFNPFDSMPSGEPNPDSEEQNNSSDDRREGRRDYSEHTDMEGLSKTYEMWESLTNMDEEQMDMWEEHPCSDKGVDNGEDMRDNFYMLSGQPMESWGKEEIAIANSAIDFMISETQRDVENPESGGQGTCPSRWTVNLLNRGHNPLENFPSGNPQFADGGRGGKIDDDAPNGNISGAESFDATLETTILHNFNTMTFNRIDFDELGEVSDEVAEFLSQVQAQHEQNVEFIETVTEDRDSVESELQEYKQGLAEELEDREAILFTADELIDFDLSRLHELDADSREFEEARSSEESQSQDEETEGGSNFGSREQKSQDFVGNDGGSERAKEGLRGISGIVID